VIRSFRDKETDKVFRRKISQRFRRIARAAKRKLDQIHAAVVISDLAAIPGNHLETLAGDRLGQYSIRIDQKWRICFRGIEPNAFDVEIVACQ
jgi:proteic killer suppression protein